MEAAAKESDGLRLRRIDIDSWTSPVARQYAIRSLPALVLYQGTERVAEGTDATLARLNAGL